MKDVGSASPGAFRVKFLSVRLNASAAKEFHDVWLVPVTEATEEYDVTRRQR